MTLNREVFFRDPTSFTIPNDGVAQVYDPQTPAEWDVLRYELESFVCDGEYRKGLERILSTFLASLDKAEQPAVWVSGFYGSGKSHLVRVLEYLWLDREFPDGKRARAIPKLPAEIQDLLKELSTAGKRYGGLWAAAGKIGTAAGMNVRMALLTILFKSAGLPNQYPVAKFVIWLRQSVYYDALAEKITQRGKNLDKELTNFYVSSAAECLLEINPSFATNAAAARNLLANQFPDKDDVSDDELASTIKDVLLLSTDTGKLPLTLFVFDEVQQFLNEDPERTLALQNVVELCSARFRSRVLFVATGQAALQSTPQLQRLLGRFTVQVMLSDTDVESVTRQIILRKKQDRVAELRTVLDRASGEIDRQLAGTRIGPRATDAADLTADYPLLPTRRRLWESLLRALDPSGTQAQLRTQIRIVHEAARNVANLLLGNVVGGDFLYGQLSTFMLQSRVLFPEVAQIIQEQRDGTVDGDLRSRLCASIFLVGKLPTDGVAATGVRATANTLADLLVQDLTVDSAELRQRVPILLQGLVESGVVMQIGDEYRLQTRESAEWENDYRRRLARFTADETRIASDRATAFREAVGTELKGITLTQGNSRTPRKWEFNFGSDVPTPKSGAIPVWVRDGWSTSEKNVREDAQVAGPDSPVVFVFLPKLDADALKSEIASIAAAQACVNERPTPTTPEGIEAKSAMESRVKIEQAALQGLVAGIIRDARVFQGGGNDVAGENFVASVRTALEAAVVRMFPKFNAGDSTNWDKVIKRANDGSADALSALGYMGEVAKYPTCQDIRTFIGGAGKKGSEVRRNFTGGEYGWPQDAVDGSLLVLVAAGLVRATKSGIPVPVRQISQTQIGVMDFASEGTTVTMPQRLEVRKFLSELGMQFKPGDEASALPAALERLIERANRAGGEPPLPPRPSLLSLEELRALSGNAQMVAVSEKASALVNDWKAWKASADLIAQRQPAWDVLNRLAVHARELSIANQVQPQIEAIRIERTLLVNPDPVPPLVNALSDTLRATLQGARQRLLEARDREVGALEASAEWKAISEQERKRILAANGLAVVPNIEVGTDDALLKTLDEYPLSKWDDLIAALPTRAAQAREGAARLLEPKAVRIQPPSATLRTRPEAQKYIDDLCEAIMKEIDAGRPVIL